MFQNFVPTANKNTITGETTVMLDKRQGMGLNIMNVATASGLSGTMQCLDMITMNQLSDVVVAAFYRYNGGTKTIEIAQIKPAAGTWTLIGTISTVAGPPVVTVNETSDVYLTEIKIGSTPSVAVVLTNSSNVAGTSAAYYATSTSGAFVASTLTKISDADFPTNQTPQLHIVGAIQQMNEVAYVMGLDGRIYNSNADSIGIWSALGFLEAQAYSDRGVGLMRYKHHIVGFGENSIEFFDDMGNDPTTGSPLQRTEQAFIKFGAWYGKSIINIDDQLFWLGFSNSSSNGVWKLDGYTPVQIATRDISGFIDIAKGNITNNKRGFGFQQTQFNGVKCLSIGCYGYNSFVLNTRQSYTYETNEPTIETKDAQICGLMYNINDGLWWHKNFSDRSGSWDLFAVPFYFIYTSIGNAQLAMVFAPDIVTPVATQKMLLGWDYTMYEDTYYSDYSTLTNSVTSYLAAWNSTLVMFDTDKRKFFHKYKVIPGTMLGSTASPNYEYYKMVVRKEFRTGSNNNVTIARNLKVGTGSDNQPIRLYVNNLGTFRIMQPGFLYLGVGPMSLIAWEGDFSQGTF